MNGLSPLALGIAFGSALAWAGFDLLRKLSVRAIDVGALVVWLSVAQFPLFLLWVGIDPPASVSSAYLAPAGIAIVINGAALVLYLESIKISPLSRTIPILSLTPALAAVFAYPLLDEAPSRQQLVGLSIVVLGALILNAESDDLRRPWRLPAVFVRERGSVYMLGVALLWSVAPAIDKLALAHAPPSVHGATLNAGVALCMLAVLWARGRLGQLATVRRAPKVFAGAVLFAVAALGSQFVALRLVLVSAYEAVKRSVGLVAALLLGRAVFGERIAGPQWVAALLLGVGVVLVVTG